MFRFLGGEGGGGAGSRKDQYKGGIASKVGEELGHFADLRGGGAWQERGGGVFEEGLIPQCTLIGC